VDALILVRTGQNEEDTGDNPGLWIDLVNEIQTAGQRLHIRWGFGSLSKIKGRVQ